MTVIPRNDFVLVAQNKSDTKSESGLILDSATSVMDSKTATVLAVGPNVTLVKEGDVIFLQWNKGQVVSVNGAQRVMIKEEFIVAVQE